ncbi:MAG: DUF3352 domain-containing protein, partial [Fulvivirga sp.]|nr:DUF3352 domain-containing protein [Fulvivirga sp.]
MKKTFFFLLIIAVAGAAYYYYNDGFYFKEDRNLWDFVPEHAIIVFESSEMNASLNQLADTQVGQTLFDIQSIENFNALMKGLDSLKGSSGTLSDLLEGKMLVSVHLTAKNQFGLTYFKRLAKSTQKESFTKIINTYQRDSSFNLKTRKYQGKEIYELTSSHNDQSFTYLIEENYLIASSTAFLVEDVVRLLNNDLDAFKITYEELFKLPKLSNDLGNMYVNLNRMHQGLNALGDIKNYQTLSKTFAEGAFFDFNIDDSGIYLNGFTEYKQEDFLNIFKNQIPVSSNVKYFVPNNSVYLQEFLFSESQSFYQSYQSYLYNTNSTFKKERTSFIAEYNQSESMGADWVGQNISLVQLTDKQGQLLYIDVKDKNEALNKLNTLGEAIAKINGDSVYVEYYASYTIRELQVEDYARNTFTPHYERSEVCFYTIIDNFIVFSNSIQNLKNLINNINSEATWGRSVFYNRFLDKTQEEYNVSIIFNTERYLTSINEGTSSELRTFLNENRQPINNFFLSALKLSKLDGNFYTSIVLGHTERKQVIAENFEPVQNVPVGKELITKPFVVKNHISNLKEVVVQDSAYNFILISNEGEILWSKKLDGPIIGELEQVDFYKNGKLQYFFATKNKLHLLDRLGNYVEDYPKEVPVDVAYVNVIDYDNSKRYRFLVADDRGNIYLYDKHGNNLKGWTPLSLNGKLTSTPFHIRVRKKDCFVVTLADGTVTLFNRRGQKMPNFPVDLGSRSNSEVYTNMGSNFKQTIFSGITHDGRLVQFNMEGQIIETNQLYKPTKDSEFSIVPDALGKSYIIVRKDLNRVVILDQEGNEALAKDYLGAEEIMVQFYEFNSTNKLYVIVDKVQGFTYLY